MLTLINTNRMQPPIAPVGLDYVAAAVRGAGIEVELLDLCLADDPQQAMARYFSGRQPELIGLTFRNVDDCFWPSAAWFVPELTETVARLRTLSDAPIVLGGVGFSIFAPQIVCRSGADFGIRGDGEQALVDLVHALRGRRSLEQVGGLIWRDGGTLRANAPAWPQKLSVPPARDFLDNLAYLRRGAQVGVETKRGCNRRCIYCADPLAKGPRARLRDPAEVGDEMEALLAQGVDLVHLCDSEFNIPREHARAVCDEMVRRRLGERLRWYAYLSITPFDAELARGMAAAGCVGINFTSDAADPAMLAVYRQPHGQADLAQAVRLCHEYGIAVMLDLLLGGPGETPETAATTIRFLREIGPDCAGCGVGVRIYPETAMADIVRAEGPMETNPSLRRRYEGEIDLVQPTFYISATMGPQPARLVRELIAGDPRFFEPMDEFTAERTGAEGDHNYNANRALADAIAAGARGAYWDILRKLRGV